MTSDRDVNRIVRSWLEAGSTALPDGVLDAVLDQLPSTPQRRRWPAWRFHSMHLPIRTAMAAAVVVAAVVGVSALRGQAPPIAASPTPSPTTTARPSPSLDPQSGLPWLPNNAPLNAGTYRVPVPQPLIVSVTVPDGWNAFEDWALVGPDGHALPAGVGLAFWDVANLTIDPRNEGAGLLDPQLGPTVDDLATALVAQPAYADVAGPTDVVVDGYPGKRVELAVPADLEMTDCTGESDFVSWFDRAAHVRCHQGPGQVDHVLIVDVDGHRLVIDAMFFQGSPQEHRDALDAMIETIRIDPVPTE